MGRVKEAYFAKFDHSDEEEHYLGGLDAWMEEYAERHLASIPPDPVPCDPSEEDPVLSGWNLFTPTTIARIRDRNASWLQWAPRTASEVLTGLFTNYDLAGVPEEEVLGRIALSLYEAGYCPRDTGPNPIWTFPV